MKGISKSNKKYEPTIADVLTAVQTGFSRHEDILTELQTGFSRHEDILTELQTGFSRHEDILTELQTGSARHTKAFAIFHEGQENVKEQLKDIDRRLINTQNRVEDIADTLENVTRIGAKDTLSILAHERRLQHLEKARS